MTPDEFKQIRKTKGLSCKKMAEFLGLKDRRTIQRYESGALQVPRFVVIILELTKREEKLVDALRCAWTYMPHDHPRDVDILDLIEDLGINPNNGDL